jgi:hypothetical protein
MYDSRMTDCTLVRNHAHYDGGGMNLELSSVIIGNTTFAGNTCTRVGTAIRFDTGSTPGAFLDVIDSIIWGHRSAAVVVDEPDQVRITYSDVEGGWLGEGNIDQDPRYCDRTCGQYTELGLAADSPCLGSGSGGNDMGSQPLACEQPVENIGSTLEVPADYPTIREALATICADDTILVAPGVYVEPELVMPVTGFWLRSWDPSDPEIVASTVISGAGADVALFGVPTGSVDRHLSGFTITDGGSAIVCTGASPLIDSCVIQGNHGDSSKGAGIHCNQASPVVENCVIEENSASGYGSGGVYCEFSSAPRFLNCAIVANSTEGWGGGIRSRLGSDPTLTNCKISGNHAVLGGGGLEVDSFSSLALTNCTVADNEADAGGGGIDAYDATIDIISSIHWGNSPSAISGTGGSSITATFSDIQGGWPGEGNIDADPLFASFQGFDHLLGPGSPAIDSGDPGSHDGISDWHPRWPQWHNDGPETDMGAYGGPENGAWLHTP